MNKNDLIEWGIVDTLGVAILMIDVDTSLKIIEGLVALSLGAYNAARIFIMVKEYLKDRNG